MKLRDFLKQFEGMDPELEVCVSDWQEGYLLPNGHPDVTTAQIVEGQHIPAGCHIDERKVHWRERPNGRFIRIGPDSG